MSSPQFSAAMARDEDSSRLLFFDTFSHDQAGAQEQAQPEELDQELNLDLVQFPSPVLVSEVRVIPLGAKVQANFPGGMRLGATNPTKFQIEFFVNDLSSPGAATFQRLGILPYDQSQRIQLLVEESIPTDGLVLRGRYNAITVAVYGTLSKSTAEQLAQQANQQQQQKQKQQQRQLQEQREQQENHNHFTLSSPAKHYEKSPPSQAGRLSSPSPLAAGQLSPAASSHSSSSQWAQLDTSGASSRRGGAINGSASDQLQRLGSRSPCVQGSSSPPPLGRLSSEREPVMEAKKDELMDDISDISDGDIPEMDDEGDDDGGARSGSAASASAQEGGAELDEHQDSPASEARQTSQSPTVAEKQQLATAEEDMEEISDDEADWSDGDPTAAFAASKPEEGVFDFGDEWEDPVRPLDIMVLEVGAADDEAPFRPILLKGELEPLRESLRKLAQMEASLEWIDALSSATESLSSIVAFPDEDAEVCDSLVAICSRCLDHDLAMSHQTPPAKVRHLKQGFAFVSEVFRTCRSVSRALLNRGIQAVLVSFLQRSNIAPTVSLGALHILDLSLNSKLGYDILAGRAQIEAVDFLPTHRHKPLVKGLYPELCRLGKVLGPCTKPALTALLAKFSLCACVARLSAVVQDLDTADRENGQFLEDQCCDQLCQVLSMFENAESVLAQPIKLLPARFQFQPSENVKIDPYKGLFAVFEELNFLDILLALLTAPTIGTHLSNLCCIFITKMLSKREGLELLWTNSKSTNSIIRYLHQAAMSDNDDLDASSPDNDSSGSTSTLALQIAYKVHAFGLLQKIKYSISESQYNKSSVVDYLQSLYSMTLAPVGRDCVVRVLSDLDYLGLFTQLVRESIAVPIEEEDEENVTLRPTMRGYACDLIKLVLRTCEDVLRVRNLAPTIVKLAQEEEVAKMNEALSWTRPLVEYASFSCEDLPKMCDFIKKNRESVNPMMPELITVARMILHFISPTCDMTHAHHQKFAVISIYSSNLLQHYMDILDNVCTYHPQPKLHTATLVGQSGYMLLSFIKPAVKTMLTILRTIMVARGQEFRDITPVSVLLKMFNLVSAVPPHSICSALAHAIKEDIVACLTTFTSLKFDSSSSSSNHVSNSVWTLMLKELLDFTCQLPHAYLAGLEVLSQLLPMPLPIATNTLCNGEKSDAELQTDLDQVRNMRALWSSHLYPLEEQLQRMIGLFAGISDPLLSASLKRVVVQLSDLSPLTAKLVCEAIFQSLIPFQAQSEDSNGLGEKNRGQAPDETPIAFAAWAIECQSIKTTALHLLQESNSNCCKGLEEMCLELSMPAAAAETEPSRSEYIASILQTLCDPDITLLHPRPVQSEELLANCVPQDKALEKIANAVLEQVFNTKTLDTNSLLPSIRTLHFLLEHDPGYSVVQKALHRTPRRLSSLLEKMTGLSEGSQYGLAVQALLDALHLLCNLPDSSVALFPNARTMLLPESTERSLLVEEQIDEGLWKLLRKRIAQSEEDEKGREHIVQQLDQLQQKCEDLISAKSAPSDERSNPKADDGGGAERKASSSFLPLIEIFSRRQVFTTEPVGGCDKSLLYAPMWHSDAEGLEISACTAKGHELDLVELASSSLPKEFDVALEVRQVCDEKSLETDKQLKKIQKKKTAIERKALQNKSLISSYKAGGMSSIRGGRSVFARPGHQRPDGFRSRPPNTSRPPSLHVDDFLVLQQRGQQPTGPTGYNKQSIKAAKELFAEREAAQNGAHTKSSMVGFREATKEPVYDMPRPISSGGPRGHSFKRGSMPMYRGRGGGGRPSRGWSPGPVGDSDRRFGPQSRKGSGGPWIHDGRRGGSSAIQRDRRRFPARDEVRPRHIRGMSR